MDEVSFGSIIRKARMQDDISLRKFAGMVDLSPTYISKIERGDFDPPSAHSIARIARVLHFDVDWLLAQADKVAPDLIAIILKDPKGARRLLESKGDDNG